MADGFVHFVISSLFICVRADGNVPDPSISAGGIIAIVILVAFSLVLLVSCVYQSRRLSNSQGAGSRVLRCGGCRRGFRVPASVDDAEFMCSRCVTEGRRRMSQVLEEERLARFARMKESANKTVRLQRVTSTFFKFSRKAGSNVASGSSSKVVCDSANTSMVTEGKGDSKDCKICFDDESCIVLLPCCHSGLCEGCAKDMVFMTKECYICRQEVELIAKVKPRKSIEDLSACVVAPDSLHHLKSRCNTFDENPNSEEQRNTINEDVPAFQPPETV